MGRDHLLVKCLEPTNALPNKNKIIIQHYISMSDEVIFCDSHPNSGG